MSDLGHGVFVACHGHASHGRLGYGQNSDSGMVSTNAATGVLCNGCFGGVQQSWLDLGPFLLAGLEQSWLDLGPFLLAGLEQSWLDLGPFLLAGLEQSWLDLAQGLS